ncbi:MAG: helix-turn-helix domain-containing protein [Geminicoccaceae bacterium]
MEKPDFRALRARLGLTHAEAAALFLVSRQTWINWESGRTMAPGPAWALLDRLMRVDPDRWEELPFVITERDRDPSLFAWPANAARHAEAALRLSLEFRTRQDIQRHSFVIGHAQLEAIEADDLAGVIGAIGKQPYRG